MDENAVFLRDICADPDDDAVRLIYADWLTDRGDDAARDQADLIRVQFEAAALEEDDPRQGPLGEMRKELVARVEPPTVHRMLQLGATDPVFRRGFVEGVTIGPADLLTRGEELARLVPLRAVRFGLSVYGAHEQDLRAYEGLADRPILRAVASLTLGDGEERHGRLLASPNWTRLRSLTLGPVERRAALPDALLSRLEELSLPMSPPRGRAANPVLRSDALAGLKSLRLTDAFRLRTDVESLASNEALSGLERLAVHSMSTGQRPPRDQLQVLAGAALPGLRSLNLSENLINSEDLASLLRYGPLQRSLTDLDLRLTLIGQDGGTGLGALRAPNVVRLNLNSAQLTPASVRHLGEKADLPSLRTLHLRTNRLGDDGVRWLRINTFWRGLRGLHLGYNRIGPAGMAALAEDVPPELATLDLNWNPVGDAGARVLLEGLRGTSLRVLDLSYCELTDDACDAIASCAALSGLEMLNLSRNRFTDEGAARLLRSPHLSSLTMLNLSHNDTGEATARALAESKHLRGLRLVRLYGGNVAAGLKREIRERAGGVVGWNELR